MKKVNCGHEFVNACATCAEVNAQWGNVGYELPAEFQKVYLSEGVVEFGNPVVVEPVEKPEEGPEAE